MKNADTAAREADTAEEEADFFCEEAATFAYDSEDDLYDAENAFKKAMNDLKKAVGVESVEKAEKFLSQAVTHIKEGQESLGFSKKDLDKVISALQACPN